jgi:hypothetical protein
MFPRPPAHCLGMPPAATVEANSRRYAVTSANAIYQQQCLRFEFECGLNYRLRGDRLCRLGVRLRRTLRGAVRPHWMSCRRVDLTTAISKIIS